MQRSFRLPERFEEQLGVAVANARERLEEARALGERLEAGGVPLLSTPDHFAMFADPPHLLAGPLKRAGYVIGKDNRCYPSPVDGCDYINVAASLPASNRLRKSGWPDHIAVVHPVDEDARARMAGQGYGNPFIHHITFGIAAPDLGVGADAAGSLVTRMLDVRARVSAGLGETPGTLIAALPASEIRKPGFGDRVSGWMKGIDREQFQFEEMEGGGYLLQFFVLRGGRIEVALRHATTQTFNPRSVHKISEDELSVDQGPPAGASA